MRKWVLYGISICLILMTVGCTRSEIDNTQPEGIGLEVNGMSSGLGSADDDDLYHTKFTYSIPISNNSSEDIYIKWVEPIIGEKVTTRLLSTEIRIDVNKTIPANDAIAIEGEILFDTTNMSKEEIMALEPFITGIKIDSETIIEFDWHKKDAE